MSTLRRTVAYKLPTPDVTSLLGLISLADDDVRRSFRKSYGKLLRLVCRPTTYELNGLYTLMQLYDPSLRCFMFQDFILAPTMEEYAEFLELPVQNKVPFIHFDATPKLEDLAVSLHMDPAELLLTSWHGVSGFSLKFLVGKAQEYAKSGCWIVFNAVLALCIYGIILFPNLPEFVDLDAFHLFAAGNPVPTLIGDFYHSLHYKNENRWGKNVHCCVPLLNMWFESHLPKKGPFVESADTAEWSERLMGISSEDIVWFDRDLLGSEIIFSCAGFPNVPLIGRKGCINYNPSLLVRQFGYALKSPPKEEEIQESLYCTGDLSGKLLAKLQHAWNHICRRGKPLLGKNDCQAYMPYKVWIQERVRQMQMPFPAVSRPVPIPVEEPTTVAIEVYKQVVKEKEDLIKINEELEKELAQIWSEKNEAVYSFQQQTELVNRLGVELAEEKKKRERLGKDFKSSHDMLESKKKSLDIAYREISSFNKTWNVALTNNKEREDKLKQQISALEDQLKASKRKYEEEVMVRYDLQNSLNKAVERKKKAVSQKRKLDDCFGEGAWEESIGDLQRVLNRRDLLIEGLLSQPDHQKTKRLLEEYQAYGRT